MTADAYAARKDGLTYMKDTSPLPRRPAVILAGGDDRQVAVLRALVRAGCSVQTVGLCGTDDLPDGVRLCGSLQACIRAARDSGADTLCLLLPLPISRDGETVSCQPETAIRIPLKEIIEVMATSPDIYLFGGRLPPDFLKALTERAGEAVTERVLDYYTLESIHIPNARITAEAAIMTAMEQTDTALLGSRMAVLGYGRIGQFLARLLLPLGVSVTVAARRVESLAHARGDGCDTLPLGGGDDLLPLCRGYDVIFNTIPAPVLGLGVIRRLEPRTLILDLASAPGGIAPEAIHAGRPGLRILRAPSLPGRYAPAAAGQVLADALLPCILSAVTEGRADI